MASLVLSGDTSGSITVSAPAVAGSNTQTLVATTGTLAPIVSGTAQASTSGTSIDFTGIPSWVKRVTVMFSGVSISGTSAPIIQIGGGSVETSGYAGCYNWISANNNGVSALSSSFQITGTGSAQSATYYGALVLTNISGNIWAGNGGFSRSDSTQIGTVTGGKTTASALDRVRITTVNGTDTFDAGTINILYE